MAYILIDGFDEGILDTDWRLDPNTDYDGLIEFVTGRSVVSVDAADNRPSSETLALALGPDASLARFFDETGALQLNFAFKVSETDISRNQIAFVTYRATGPVPEHDDGMAIQIASDGAIQLIRSTWSHYDLNSNEFNETFPYQPWGSDLVIASTPANRVRPGEWNFLSIGLSVVAGDEINTVAWDIKLNGSNQFLVAVDPEIRTEHDVFNYLVLGGIGNVVTFDDLSIANIGSACATQLVVDEGEVRPVWPSITGESVTDSNEPDPCDCSKPIKMRGIKYVFVDGYPATYLDYEDFRVCQASGDFKFSSGAFYTLDMGERVLLSKEPTTFEIHFWRDFASNEDTSWLFEQYDQASICLLNMLAAEYDRDTDAEASWLQKALSAINAVNDSENALLAGPRRGTIKRPASWTIPSWRY